MIMQKRFLLLLACFSSLQFLSAQNVKYHYAKIYEQADLTINKAVVCIDYGQSRKLARDNRIRNDNGDIQHFNSLIDALNFMVDNEWEFVQAYTYAITVNQNNYHYLIRKPIVNKQETDFFPKTKRDFD